MYKQNLCEIEDVCRVRICWLMRAIAYKLILFFFLMIRRPRRSPLFPYTTLFRSRLDFMSAAAVEEPGYRDANAARLHRWRIDLARGGVASTPLDDIVTEFPRVDERRLGRRHRFGYMAAREPELNDGAQPLWTAVRKYDLERGAVAQRRFGAGNGVAEPPFVPRSAAA